MKNLVSQLDFKVDINKTCSVTGHRYLDDNFDYFKLKDSLKQVGLEGYDTFLIGMALGFDTACFKVLLEIKKELNLDIKLIACVPCENQDRYFNFRQKATYKEMLKLADQVVILSKSYTPACMQARNKFMVNNSSLLFCYVRKTFGGSVSTLNYAKEKGKKIKRF